MSNSQEQDSGSILDRVLNRKQSDDIEQFSPIDSIAGLFKSLSPREEEILRRRHGLHGKGAETLEHIGAQYNVTRERIRQIESGAIAKLRKHHDTLALVRPVADAVVHVLDQHGGIMREEMLMAQLVSDSAEKETAGFAALFIMQYLLNDRVKPFTEDALLYPSWQLLTAPGHLVEPTIQDAVHILTLATKPMPASELLGQFRKTTFASEHHFQLSDEAILSYISMSRQIARNPYDEYGLASWGTVIPKRMNDKIFLVLKKAGKPLHFNEITQLINETKFDHRIAYPPTVHNELILNDQYVLIGRGIYALRDWGYKPGVVADILENIMRKSSQPLTRDGLVAEVLKQRMVKKNTIYLALTNRKRFMKSEDGTFTLATPQNP